MTEQELEWLWSEFSRTKHWIQAALDRDLGTHDIDDVWDAIEAGRAQLWPTPNAVMVTRIDTYPKARVLFGWLAGGALEEIVSSEKNIRDFATKNGCTIVVIGGRLGWVRVFPGYELAYHVIIKRL